MSVDHIYGYSTHSQLSRFGTSLSFLLHFIAAHMSVERVLNVPELLRAIIECLPTYPSVLSNVSWVVHSFTDPALDTLWRAPPTSFHLLQLLPSFDWFDGHYVSVDLPP